MGEILKLPDWDNYLSIMAIRNIHKVVHSDFFYAKGKKTTEDIFNDIVEQLKTKGESVSSYSYIEPPKVDDKVLADHARATLQAIETKEKLFEALTNITLERRVRSKI